MSGQSSYRSDKRLTDLPPAFLVLAEAALTTGGIDKDVPLRLREIAALVSPILTVENLVGRDRGITGAALDFLDAHPAGGAYLDEEDRAYGEQCRTASVAVEFGLVAGFLLARMMTSSGPGA